MIAARRGDGSKVVAALTGLAFLASACISQTAPAQTAPAQTAGPVRTLVVGTVSAASGCDGTTLVTYAINLSCPAATQETLVSFDWAKNEVRPSLATSWDATRDVITFKLRSGVKFHDGTPFNADAVVFNLRRVFDKSFPANAGLTFPYASYVPFKGVEKVDDMTVKVTITPTPNAIWAFSSLATYIQSPTAVQSKGKDYAFNPVGTGPYRIVSFEDKVRFELARNESYWGTKPAPDRIVVLNKADASSAANDLLAGNIDALIEPPVEQIDQLKAAGLEVQFFPSLTYNYFALNVTKPPFDDVKVRQAANYAYDQDALAKVAKGGATPMHAAWFKDAYAYNADVVGYARDPKKAQQLLDEAGWKLPAGGKVREKAGLPLAVKFFDRTGRTGVQGASVNILISNLQDVGFKVETEAVEVGVYIGKAGVGDRTRFNIANFGQVNLFPDPQLSLTRWTTAFFPPTEFNVAYYSNKRYDDLVASAAIELNAEKRIQVLKDAQKILREDAPIIWTSQSSIGMAWNRTKVTAIPLLPTTIVDIWGIAFK